MTISVRVAEGRVVRDQRGHAVPEGAFSVDERDLFWARLLRDGDVVAVTAKAAATAKAATPADTINGGAKP